MAELAYITKDDLAASLRPVATLGLTIRDLERKGIRFSRVETNLGPADAAMLEANGLQFALEREDERPNQTEVEVLASETVDPAEALATILRVVGLPPGVVTWRLDAG